MFDVRPNLAVEGKLVWVEVRKIAVRNIAVIELDESFHFLKSYMNEEVRVTLYQNSLNPVNGKALLVDVNLDLQQLLKIFSTELGIKAKKIYTGSGTLLKSPRSLRDGTALYVSQGEPLFVRSPKAKANPRSSYSTVLLGASGVGKTSIAKRYANCVFENSYESSIEDFYLKQTLIDQERISVGILDTNGSKDFDTLKESWMRKKDAIILVHSADVEHSLEYIEEDYQRICSLQSIESVDAPVIVVATNKCDLNITRTTEAGRSLAKLLGLKHFEISAALNTGIDAMLTFIVKKVQKKRVQIFRTESRCFCNECLLL